MAKKLDFSRAVYQTLITKEDRLFDAILDFTRSDGADVIFTSKEMVMDIFTNQGGTLKVSLTVGTEITINVARLTFNKIFTELDNRKYHYELYNDTDKIGVAYGPLEVK